jgi:ATP-dependent DNA helicase DinG
MEAASAHLLLANHHILFADLALRGNGNDIAAIMPRYDAVILDEAHNVEDIAISYFDAGLNRGGLMGHLGRLVSRRRSERGLVPFLRQKIGGLRGLRGETREKMLELVESLVSEIKEVRERLDVLFEELGQTLVSWLGNNNTFPDSSLSPGSGPALQTPNEITGSDSPGDVTEKMSDSEVEVRWRIPLSRRNEPPWAGVQDRIEEIIVLIATAVAPLRKVCSRLRELVEEGLDDLEHVWVDLSAVFNRLDASAGFLKKVLEGEQQEEVFWAEVRRRRGRLQVSLHMTPLDAAPILQQTLFHQVPSIVLTSATLTVTDRFDFLDERLGIGELEDRVVVHRVYPSPFDLSGQMRLAVLDDLPDPGKPGFVEAFSAAVLDSILSSEGGGLILFTSYRTLSRVYELCEAPLLEAGIKSMRQGEMPRTVLLERFRADPDSVLFATDSFWEGVDVVGSSLRVVILARLPFPVPTDPVNEARNDVLLGQGRDPFLEDSVPRAVIRMRQGIGRLVRHREDSGYAVICDGRIVRRAYGWIFLQSLGDVTAHRLGTEELKRDIGEFLGKR